MSSEFVKGVPCMTQYGQKRLSIFNPCAGNVRSGTEKLVSAMPFAIWMPKYRKWKINKCRKIKVSKLKKENKNKYEWKKMTRKKILIDKKRKTQEYFQRSCNKKKMVKK